MKFFLLQVGGRHVIGLHLEAIYGPHFAVSNISILKIVGTVNFIYVPTAIFTRY